MRLNKSLFRSKTFYFGLLTALLPLFPDLAKFLAEYPKTLGAIWSIAIIVLRMATKDKVKLLR